jgi:hypothetical protein
LYTLKKGCEFSKGRETVGLYVIFLFLSLFILIGSILYAIQGGLVLRNSSAIILPLAVFGFISSVLKIINLNKLKK